VLKQVRYGYLPKSQGHEVYYADIGNPSGIPILSFHSGPGGETWVDFYNFIDLEKYRIVTFDQRGCGKSKPLGKLEDNTPYSLIEDARRLLTHLSIDAKVILFGGSWGSTLSLLFAETYPEKVAKMLLSNILLAREQDLDWILSSGIARFYPDFNLSAKKDVYAYLKSIVNNEDEQSLVKGLKEYFSFECNLVSLNPIHFSVENMTIKDMQQKKIYLHYLSNKMFLEDNAIMNAVHKIEDIPITIIHNRMDLICPIDQAWELKTYTNNSKLIIIPEQGHGGDFQIEYMFKFFQEA
jgi:proline iminopeptidase